MSVRVRPLPQEDQVANVGAGTRLQNVKHEFDSHPGLKKVFYLCNMKWLRQFIRELRCITIHQWCQWEPPKKPYGPSTCKKCGLIWDL